MRGGIYSPSPQMAVGAISAGSVGRPSDVGRPKTPIVGRAIRIRRPKDPRELHTNPDRNSIVGRPILRTSENQRASDQIANPLYRKQPSAWRVVGRPKCR